MYKCHQQVHNSHAYFSLHYKKYNFISAAPSGPPTRINIRPLNSTSIHISWDLPSAEHQNGEIDHYNVLCIEVNTRRMLARHTTLAMDITIIELHPYYTYRCNVSAVTVDEGPFSDSVEVTTLEDSMWCMVFCTLTC